jgi:hypothetical protein
LAIASGDCRLPIDDCRLSGDCPVVIGIGDCRVVINER